MREKPKPTKKQLRSFGLIVGVGFTLIALWPIVFRRESPRMWLLGFALLLAAAALVVPSVLAPLFRVWMFIGEILGWINTRIILTVLYYLLIVPMGFLMRLTGRDPLDRRFDRSASSYRIARSKRHASHMQRQY